MSIVRRGSWKCDLDYLKFVTLAAQQTPNAPLILEYVGTHDYKAALVHLRATLAKAGLAAR